MIIVKDLHKSFEDNQVLKGVSYHIHPGEKIVVVGPSGSGKSTFLRCLNLLEKPSSGRVIFEGTDITDKKVNIDLHRQKIGMVFQHFNVFPHLTVLENITITPRLEKKVPKAEIDGDIGDSHVGLQARMMSQAMRKLSASINKTKTIAIFINQLREKVGIMFGNPETTPGGRALKFYASVRLDVRGNTQIKGTGDKKDQNVGKETKIKVVKNKVAPPFKEAFVEIMYGEGISQTGELVKIASDLGIIQKAGAWFSYNGEKIGQGSENAKKYLADHPDIFEEIDHKVRVHYGLIEPDEEDSVEEAQVEETSDELVLDLDSTIEIEE